MYDLEKYLVYCTVKNLNLNFDLLMLPILYENTNFIS